jgi:hypothetical protein
MATKPSPHRGPESGSTRWPTSLAIRPIASLRAIQTTFHRNVMRAWNPARPRSRTIGADDRPLPGYLGQQLVGTVTRLTRTSRPARRRGGQMSSYLACGPITRPMERGLEPPDRTCPIRLPGTGGPGKPGQPVRRAGPRRHRVLPYHPRPDVHAVLAEAGVRNVGGNHPRRDDDIPRGPDQTVEAVSDRGGDRGDGHGNKLADHRGRR